MVTKMPLKMEVSDEYGEPKVGNKWSRRMRDL